MLAQNWSVSHARMMDRQLKSTRLQYTLILNTNTCYVSWIYIMWWTLSKDSWCGWRVYLHTFRWGGNSSLLKCCFFVIPQSIISYVQEEVIFLLSETLPWPLFTSLMHTHWPSSDSFHRLTCRKISINMKTFDQSFNPITWQL